LYHKSWALFVDSDIDAAITFLNEIIDLLKANDMIQNTLKYFKQHADMAPALATQQWKEKQLKIYIYKFTLTVDGFPSVKEVIEKLC